jgi:hypothetical protein
VINRLLDGFEGKLSTSKYAKLGEQCRVARSLTPALSQRERQSDSEVVLVGRLREAIRRLNPAIPENDGSGAVCPRPEPNQ